LGLTASEITKKGFGSNQIAGPVNPDTPYYNAKEGIQHG
jgi:hypothetical protein